MCSMAVCQRRGSVGEAGVEAVGEEDQGRTSEEEEGGAESSYDRQVGFESCALRSQQDCNEWKIVLFV